MSTLLIGYATGLALSAALVPWASAQRIGADFLSNCTAMFNPLPAIALPPLATNLRVIGFDCTCMHAYTTLLFHPHHTGLIRYGFDLAVAHESPEASVQIGGRLLCQSVARW